MQEQHEEDTIKTHDPEEDTEKQEEQKREQEQEQEQEHHEEAEKHQGEEEQNHEEAEKHQGEEEQHQEEAEQPLKERDHEGQPEEHGAGGGPQREEGKALTLDQWLEQECEPMKDLSPRSDLIGAQKPLGGDLSDRAPETNLSPPLHKIY